MISQRLTRPARVFAPAFLALGIALSTASPLAWRPGGLPGDGDPAETELSFLRPVWETPAATSRAPAGSPSRASAGSPSRAAGLFIALDPVSRLPVTPSAQQLRDAAAAAAQLEREDALRAPLAPLRVERLPGGGEIVHLNGRFQVYSVARRDPNGRIVTDCAPDPEAARRLLSEPVPAKSRGEER